MLQPAGDLGLEQEAAPTGGVVGVLVEDLLERHLAVELGVQRDEDGAQAAPGMGPHDPEPLAVGGRRAQRIAGRAVGVAVVGRGAARGDLAERPLDVRVLHGGQALERGLAGGDVGQAPRDVAAVRLDVQVGQGLDHRPLGVAQVAQGDEVVGQGSRLVAGPGMKSGHELGRLDQASLQREQAEQEVAFGGDGSHGEVLQ
jgi:hypothetical protein